MKVTVHFVRHGQTMFNFEDKIQGWSDSFLTPDGIIGVERLGQYWRQQEQKFDRIYSSDSGRTLQTARILVQQMATRNDVIPVSGLREYNFGYYEGQDELTLEKDLRRKNASFSDLALRPKAVIDAIAELDKEKKDETANTWMAEPAKEYVVRLVQTMNQITNESLKLGHKEILIVSHGMSIAFLLAEICPDYWRNEKFRGIANASVSTAEYHNGKYKLLSFGEVKA